MPPWFIDIESATEIEAKSNGTPPASRTPPQASRANAPSSALHGVTRPSVEATPTKGFFRSPPFTPSAPRNARCGARSSPSTVMRDGSFFVILMAAAILKTGGEDASKRYGIAARAGRCVLRVGAELSGAQRQDRRAVRHRRPRRHLRPFPRREADRFARPPVRGRGPARRRLDRRQRRGREIRARWLHAAGDVEHAYCKRDAGAEEAVRP